MPGQTGPLTGDRQADVLTSWSSPQIENRLNNHFQRRFAASTWSPTKKVFFDLDGLLIDGRHTIPERWKRTCDRLVVRCEHAFLLAHGGRLPPKGAVFRDS